MDEIKKQSTLDDVMHKSAVKKQIAKERKEEKETLNIVNKLVIDRTPSGLYSCRYSMRGQVPEELKGLFTRKDRILEICNKRNISVEELTV